VLHSLIISSSDLLQRLGNFPRLISLHLQECEGFTTVGEMDNLKELHLHDMKGNVLSQFPIEQLEKLVISSRIVNDFPTISHRLRSLKDLQLDFTLHSVEDRVFIAQQYPFLNSLVKLHLKYFNEIDLIGLVNLRHLSIAETVAHRIRGKNFIYPNLKSFSFKTTSRREDKMDFSRTKLSNISEFTYVSPSTVENKPFPVPASRRSFSLHVKRMNFLHCPAGRSFHKVQLTESSWPDYSLFSNVQILNLRKCSVVDVSPFKNIPYLDLDTLVNVKDFSCLGNQKYLKVAKCDGLSTDAVSHFGNVFHLCIINCRNVVAAKGLWRNQFLILKFNKGLPSGRGLYCCEYKVL
jgi:hypothetical protein